MTGLGMNFRCSIISLLSTRVLSLMAESQSPQYERDEDGHVREIVGPWVKDKHDRLARYVGISRSVRKMFLGTRKAGATFIDLYSGPGRVRIRGEAHGTPGSALVAWHEAADGGAAFTQVHVADADRKLLDAWKRG
jgi:hypothetical protein